MAITSADDLTARQKAAIVVMTLGSDAKELLARLGDTKVEQLAEEFIQLGDIPETVRDAVLAQFHNKMAASQQVSDNGLQRAAKVLEARLGKEQAGEAVKRMEWRANQQLRSYARLDPARFAKMVELEHPQTAAFLLTQLDQPVSAKVIESLSEKWQHEMVWRIATMRAIPPEIAGAVHQALSSKYKTQGAAAQRLEPFGGESKAASVLNMVGMEAQRTVLDTLASLDADIAKRVRKLMFVFKDILLIDDRGLQRLLKEVDTKVLVMALKNSEEAIQEKFFKNVSERMRQTLKDEIEFLRNPKPVEIEEARDAIIDQLRGLEEKGEIVIDRTGGAGNAG